LPRHNLSLLFGCARISCSPFLVSYSLLLALLPDAALLIICCCLRKGPHVSHFL